MNFWTRAELSIAFILLRAANLLLAPRAPEWNSDVLPRCHCDTLCSTENPFYNNISRAQVQMYNTAQSIGVAPETETTRRALCGELSNKFRAHQNFIIAECAIRGQAWNNDHYIIIVHYFKSYIWDNCTPATFNTARGLIGLRGQISFLHARFKKSDIFCAHAKKHPFCIKWISDANELAVLERSMSQAFNRQESRDLRWATWRLETFLLLLMTS